MELREKPAEDKIECRRRVELVQQFMKQREQQRAKAALCSTSVRRVKLHGLPSNNRHI